MNKNFAIKSEEFSGFGKFKSINGIQSASEKLKKFTCDNIINYIANSFGTLNNVDSYVITRLDNLSSGITIPTLVNKDNKLVFNVFINTSYYDSLNEDEIAIKQLVARDYILSYLNLMKVTPDLNLLILSKVIFIMTMSYFGVKIIVPIVDKDLLSKFKTEYSKYQSRMFSNSSKSEHGYFYRFGSLFASDEEFTMQERLANTSFSLCNPVGDPI